MAMADISEYPESLRDMMEMFEDIDEHGRAEILLDYSSRFQEVPSNIAERPFPEDHRVQRCESEAYVFTESAPNGGINFYFAVENPQGVSARALGAILQESLMGADAQTIKTIPHDIVFRLFGKRISMGKGEGLLGMVALLKYFAELTQKEQASS
jgi:cysteine desulfuration protein SufE